jgi:hypothetical protein
MAETLTMESNVEKTSIDSLSAEEQDSLQVGEQMQEAQDNLLAGKYKSAQELEQGYLELQKKLGQQTEEAPETTEEQPEEEQGEPTILDRIWEESTSREEFTPELTEEISKLSSTELANMYLDYRQNVEEAAPQTRDFTEQEVGELKGIVGGDQQYTQMLDWAQSNLNKQEIDMFDQVMQTGDPLAAFFAVRSLGYAYQNAIGYDGNMIQGKAPKQNTDQFRSQAEVIAAMGDPRYENDPAYRRDIMDKLERSPNVNF